MQPPAATIDFDKLRRLRILYVEDDPTIQEQLSETLRMDMETVLVASNGQEGLEMYRRHQPDAIISDIRMPVMDGLEMIRHIRETDTEIPIIITTAFNESEYLLRSIDLGVDGYITKPVNVDKLLYTLYKNCLPLLERRENEAKSILLRLVMEQNPALMVVTRDGKEKFISQTWQKQLGNRSIGTILGDQEGSPLGEKWEEKVAQMSQAPLRILDGSGAVKFVSVTAVCVLENRTILYTFHDVTQMVQQYDALSESYRETKEMMAFQSKLASMGEMIEAIAHQWRQPLNVIGISMGLIEMELEEDEVNRDSVRDSLETCQDQVTHMNETIEDFRAFIKPNRKKEHFLVRPSIEQVLHLFGKQYRHANMKINVSGEDLKLYGYQNEFQHVVINLLNNTRDALIERKIKPGYVEIVLHSNEDSSAITLTDNAGGISKDMIDSMFQKRITTKGEKGTGIGMLMCKRIVEEGMGGTIWAKNEGDGIQITIKFPVQKDEYGQ